LKFALKQGSAELCEFLYIIKIRLYLKLSRKSVSPIVINDFGIPKFLGGGKGGWQGRVFDEGELRGNLEFQNDKNSSEILKVLID